jgi:hypothetical protein
VFEYAYREALPSFADDLAEVRRALGAERGDG